MRGSGRNEGGESMRCDLYTDLTQRTKPTRDETGRAKRANPIILLNYVVGSDWFVGYIDYAIPSGFCYKLGLFETESKCRLY